MDITEKEMQFMLLLFKNPEKEMRRKGKSLFSENLKFSIKNNNQVDQCTGRNRELS